MPGRGSSVAQTGDGRAVGVINVMGRVFMLPIDDPFAVVLREIESIRHRTRVIIVDFHAEATSEKIAMGWHLDGRVTAIIGTHTHVQTADERILPKGTAYLTDVGMTGPMIPIIGMEVGPSLARFPERHAGEVRTRDRKRPIERLSSSRRTIEPGWRRAWCESAIPKRELAGVGELGERSEGHASYADDIAVRFAVRGARA